MPLKKENDLSPNHRALYQKAKQAMSIGNHGYVIQLMQPVMKEYPEFLDGRKLVRAAALKATDGKKTGLSIAGTTLGISGGQVIKKGDYATAIEMAEKALSADPRSTQANQLLFEAATKAGMPETAAFALETLVGNNPNDTKVLHQLADHYMLNGDNEKAVSICNRITAVNPADLAAIKKGKDAAASSTMKKGGWDEAASSGGTKSFRDLIANKDEAKKLEDKSKVVRTSEQISGQISDIYPQWEENQQNVDVSKRIASLYEQWFEVTLADNGPTEEADQHLDSALWFFNHTNTVLNGGDPNILRKCQDLSFKKTDRRIASLEAWLSTVEDPTHPDAVPYVDELNALKTERAAGTLDTAKKRVEDNPTDLQFRYEYGEVLMKAGKYTEAVPELQRARQNPNVRLRAMNLLGQCFVEKGMLDLAVTQFKTASSEIIAMDPTKKEVLYKLALVYEKMKKKDEYLECLKQIYEADYGYLDVAQRVESSYEA